MYNNSISTHPLHTLHFLKVPENSLEVLKVMENKFELLKVLENNLKLLKVLKNNLESLKLQENRLVLDEADMMFDRGFGPDIRKFLAPLNNRAQSRSLDNKDSPEGITYLFKCLDLNGRGFLTTADIHTLFRNVHQKWIEGGNYELCIEDVRDEIWDMVKPADPLRITLSDLLSCKQGGTVASMLIDVRGF
ncbi:putative serine/threonine-protein phosphatase 2A regulatory subunit B'' subunit TON2 [Tanacetum coccineum]